MANKGIKGITIEIGGDTTGLDNALRDVNQQSKNLQNELKQVERALKFDPGNIELVRQRQELLTESIQATSERLGTLRTAQAQVEAQFQRGDIGVEQYRAFQRELQSTEGELNRLQGQLNSLGAEQDRLAQTTRQLGTFFDATGTDVEQFAGTLGTRLTQAIRDGSANADQMERALRLMGRQALGAGADIDQLREALRTADNGANLDQIRADLDRISQSANDAEQSVNGFGGELSAVVGGLAAGGGIAGVVSQALDVSSLNTKIDITFDVPEESKKAVYDAVKQVEVYGVEGEEALEGVRRQWALNKEASDGMNKSIVEGAGIITKSYAGIDFIELVQEVNEIASALEISNEEALYLTNSLLKFGFPPEQLDTIAEYGLQMKSIGFSTAEIQSIFEKGVDLKTWNIDNLNDGVKEANIKMKEYGKEVPKALAAVLKGTTVSTQQMQNWGKAVASGGEEGAKAMSEVSKWLQTIEDDTLRNEMAVAVFGTKAEDQGDNMIAVFQGLADAQDKTIQNQEEFNAASENYNADTLIQMKEAFMNLMTALQPLLLMVAGFIAQIAQWVADNAALSAAIVAISTVLGILVGVFAALMPAIGALVSIWPVLAAAFTSAGGVVSLLTSSLSFLGPVFAALTGPIGLTIAAIVAIGAGLVVAYNKVGWFRDGVNEIWAQIKDLTSTAFTAVKKLISDLIGSAVELGKNLLGSFKDFWDENGKFIVSSVKLYFGQVKANIEMVMGIIKGIFQVVWPIISGVVKIAWENIKLVVQNSIDLVLGIIQTVMKLIQGDWKGAWETIKKTAMTIMDNIVGSFEGLNLLQVGKDIINGLVKGIGSMTDAVKKKVEDLAAHIPQWAKDILGIKSPSRVMMEVGKWTGLGLAGGIDGTQSDVQKSVKDLGGLIIDVAENNIQQEKEIREKADAEILKLRKDAADKIADLEKKSGDKILGIQESAAKSKKGMTTAQQRAILSSRKDTADKVMKLEETTAEKIAKIEAKAKSDSVKLISANQKEVLEEIKLYISDKQSMEEMNLVQEAAIWEKSISLFEEGTKERVEAQKAYRTAVESINKEILSINTDFQSKIKTVSDNLVKNEEAATKLYTDAVENRKNALMSFAGTFDAFRVEMQTTGVELLNNLQSQVDGFKTWQDEFTKLSSRGVDADLLDELSGLGVKALPELLALNQLTDEQLTQYSALYQEKAQLARTQAETELVGMKTDTQAKIDDMRKAANTELSKLHTDWDAKIKAVTQSTSTELSSLKQIGADAGQGLLDGLTSMEGPLIDKATQIANAISGAIQSALDIHSPSRVMKGFGVNIGQGLIVGMDNMINKVAQSSARLSDAVQNAQVSLNGSAQRSKDSTTSGTSNTTSSTTTTTTENHYHMTFTSPKPMDPYESARLAKNAMKELSLQI